MKDEIEARLTGASLFLYSALSGTLVQRCCMRTLNGATIDSPCFSEMKLRKGEREEGREGGREGGRRKEGGGEEGRGGRGEREGGEGEERRREREGEGREEGGRRE